MLWSKQNDAHSTERYLKKKWRDYLGMIIIIVMSMLRMIRHAWKFMIVLLLLDRWKRFRVSRIRASGIDLHLTESNRT